MAYIIYGNIEDAKSDSHEKMKSLDHWGCRCDGERCSDNCPQSDNATIYWWPIIVGTENRWAIDIGTDPAPTGRESVTTLPEGFLPPSIVYTLIKE
jgi:hypothetical protein